MAHPIEWKDYVVISNLDKHDRESFRSWLKNNNRIQPVCSWENENANDCAYLQDYRYFLEWRRLQTH